MGFITDQMSPETLEVVERAEKASAEINATFETSGEGPDVGIEDHISMLNGYLDEVVENLAANTFYQDYISKGVDVDFEKLSLEQLDEEEAIIASRTQYIHLVQTKDLLVQQLQSLGADPLA